MYFLFWPCQRPLIKSVCVHDHSHIQFADDIVHKLNQLGFARPLTLETMLTDRGGSLRS